MIQLDDVLPDSFDLLNKAGETPLFIDCGILNYAQALELQNTLHEKVLSGEVPSLFLLVEHPPVITLGLHKEHNRLLNDESQLAEKGIDIVQIRRGGGSTAHNPGQLVLYPIVHLPSLRFRVAPFVHYLEQIGIDLLEKTGIHAERVARYPGLWVNGRKIASVGVQIAHSVSMHGIAINISNDLDIFSSIIPCGIDGVEMTSVAEEGGKIPGMTELKELVPEIALSLMREFCRAPKENADV